MQIFDEQLREEGEIGLAGWTGHTLGMTTAHRHVDLEINYVLSGSMTYLVGGRLVPLPLQRLCLLWGGVPHQMLRGSGVAEAIWVTIPLTTVLRWGLPEGLIQPLLATGYLADSQPLAGDFNQLVQWINDLPKHAVHRPTIARENRGANQYDTVQRIVLLEIEARLRRFVIGLAVASPEDSRVGLTAVSLTPAHPDRGLVAVEAMAQFMSSKFRDDIGVAEIAEEAHLHPNYAMTLFRRHTGMTLSQYLVLQRVAHAQRLLSTTDEAIASIALDSGFGSVSRFYEAFRQQTGNTPRGFRLHMAPAPEA